MEDTKVIYHVDDEETPYLVKLPVLPSAVTLGDFKNALNRPNYKFFFNVVKEEITEDDARLPCFNGKVISWVCTQYSSGNCSNKLVSADSSTKSDNHSSGINDTHSSGPSQKHSDSTKPDSGVSSKAVEPPSEQEHAVGTTGHGLEDCDTCAESDSVYSGDRVPPLRNFHAYKYGSRLTRMGQRGQSYETSSSMMSSDLESTSFLDSDDESSRFSTATGTSMSSAKYARHRRQRHQRRRLLPVRRVSEDASSFSSMTDSTMSLNVINVTLNMDTVNFLGISIVGQSNKAGDGGIYVGSIMRGGAVAQDGRIEPGDMILEVNRISFEDMSNDEAVRVLREEVQKPGPITLVVAKCWDPSPNNYFTVPRQEPVRPIDPRAWVLHTNAMTGAVAPGSAASGQPFLDPGSPPTGMNMMQGAYLGMIGNPATGMPAVPPGMPQLIPTPLSALTSLPSSSVVTSMSLPEQAEGNEQQVSDSRAYRSGGPGSSGAPTGTGGPGSNKTTGSRSAGDGAGEHGSNGSLLAGGNNTKSTNSLTVTTDMVSVVQSMLLPDSGLEIHDRTWLKITIPNAFIGSDLVDWLYAHVDGFADRRDARRYAAELLKYGYIRHTVNKNTFSEQCYYVFGDLAAALSHLNLEDVDSVSEVGGPSNALHTGMHGISPGGRQLFSLTSRHHPHHGLADSASSGLTVLPNPNSSVVFGMIPPGSSGSNASAELVGSPSGNNSGPLPTHYPIYPSMLYPVAASHSDPTSGAVTGLMGSTTSQPSGPIPSGVAPASHVPGQRIVNNFDRTSGLGNQMLFPGNTQGYPGSVPVQFCHTHPLTSQPQSSNNQQPQKKSGDHGHSSSSCSSQSSASSASSSSGSTASSGTRLGRNMKATSGHGNTVRPNEHASATEQLTSSGPMQTRHTASSVQSASGASSASSASRKNGTGASGTGSGSGSGATTGRLTSRLPPSGSGPIDPCKRTAISTTRLPVSISGQAGTVNELVPQTAPPVPSHAPNTTSCNKTAVSVTKTCGPIPQQQQR
ncbi:Segment polarity protein dishevelled DVL-3 [Fasciola gigantica]|uniref:Segment polarity protein dishevelled DVL-3 n=1 Tax=Fasciola gigantica TaxID=46835 RepID=A0A504YHM4_FASGI|nr:Segment polarity protein dishevelled DVL-3 [Fasciola gigantica]